MGGNRSEEIVGVILTHGNGVTERVDICFRNGSRTGGVDLDSATGGTLWISSSRRANVLSPSAV